MFEKFTSIVSRIFIYSVEIYNTYLLYKFFPSFWIILFSFVFHSYLTKFTYDVVSKGEYSKLLERVSAEILSNKKLDMTEINEFTENNRFYLMLSSAIVMCVLYCLYIAING